MAQKGITSDQILSVEEIKILNNEFYDEFVAPVIKSVQELSLKTNFYNEQAITSSSTLDDKKTNAKSIVDQTAERIRSKYITPGAGQTLVYQEKSDEATDYITAGYPVDLTSYPFIQAEVNATGKTKEQAADDIIAAKATTIAALVSIEEERLSGKRNIDDVVDESGINSICDAAITALEEL